MLVVVPGCSSGIEPWFTTPDTTTILVAPGNANLCSYAGDNSANSIDPTGRSMPDYLISCGAGAAESPLIGADETLLEPHSQARSEAPSGYART